MLRQTGENVGGARYTYSMNTNKKATSTLSHGDYFIYRGERAKFLHYTGYPRHTRYGVYKMAFVMTPDSNIVKWSLNQAGSVEVTGHSVD